VLVDGLMARRTADRFLAGIPLGHVAVAGQSITVDDLMDQTAITYPYVTSTTSPGETIKTILEDVADNLFNPTLLPAGRRHGPRRRPQVRDRSARAMGRRISNMTLAGGRSRRRRRYKVAGWAPVSKRRSARAASPSGT
jgi:sulfur-oxidizing protein SoxB